MGAAASDVATYAKEPAFDPEIAKDEDKQETRLKRVAIADIKAGQEVEIDPDGNVYPVEVSNG